MTNLPDIWREMDRPFGAVTAWRPLLRQLDDLFNETVGRMDAVQTTIKSTVQQARSIFAEELLQSAPYRKLKLPDLAGFRAMNFGREVFESCFYFWKRLRR